MTTSDLRKFPFKADNDVVVGATCQSDDQFFVWDFALSHGWSVSLHGGLISRLSLTLPFEFEGETFHTNLKPFDAKLHRLAEVLRHATV